MPPAGLSKRSDREAAACSDSAPAMKQAITTKTVDKWKKDGAFATVQGGRSQPRALPELLCMQAKLEGMKNYNPAFFENLRARTLLLLMHL